MKITIKETIKVQNFIELILFLDYYQSTYTYEEMMKQYVLNQMTDLYNRRLDQKKIMCNADEKNRAITVSIIDLGTNIAEEYTINETKYKELTKE